MKIWQITYYQRDRTAKGVPVRSIVTIQTHRSNWLSLDSDHENLDDFEIKISNQEKLQNNNDL